MQNLQDVFLLQTNGSGVLSFSSVSSDFVKLATGTISSSTASISFDGYFTSTYNIYKFFWYDCRTATNNGSRFVLRYRRSNADITASNYRSVVAGASIGAGGTGDNKPNSWDLSYISLNDSTWYISNQNFSFCGDLTLYNPLGTSLYKTVTWNSMAEYEASYWYSQAGSGTLMDNTNALSGISFLMSGANIASGKFALYGLKI